MTDKEIRIGKPTVSKESIDLIMDCLKNKSVSEGYMTYMLERKLEQVLNYKHVVLANSGHSALVLAFRAAKDLYGRNRIITTPITFISTISAALSAGLQVSCVDTKQGSFLMNEEQAQDIARDTDIYCPVHLFGYEVPAISKENGSFIVQDCCEAFGTKFKTYGERRGISCFSFYTSHVLGSGEMGCIATDDDVEFEFIQSIKDQGRYAPREFDHVDKFIKRKWSGRYAHRYVGYNFRTTDIQAALIYGSIKYLPTVLERRVSVVRYLNENLALYALIKVPNLDSDVSYLGYPIICDNQAIRDDMVDALEERKIETRPLMSLIPEERAVYREVDCPRGYVNAMGIHSRGFYISCHDSLEMEDLNYIVKSFREILG